MIDDTFSAYAGSCLYGFQGEIGSGEELHSTAETCVVIDPTLLGFLSCLEGDTPSRPVSSPQVYPFMQPQPQMIGAFPERTKDQFNVSERSTRPFLGGN